jgi:hypothetical protein
VQGSAGVGRLLRFQFSAFMLLRVRVVCEVAIE